MSWSYACDVVIARSPEDVFAWCSDLRHEMQWNPSARSVEVLTDGPLGVGTRYAARWTNAPSTLVEVVRYDPPGSWETRSRVLGMEVRVSGSVEAHPKGARYAMRLELLARGAARLLAPFAFLGMRLQDRRNMERIREALEAEGSQAPASLPSGVRRP